ncbi:adenine/cytosine DNA methyltransferase [Nemorincola caseinilytica]|uniref:DNA (cytosine-5-)-methyltransferase n=1 Tax=Nemorincola caseinilytica TaxID=2054315 RepID=A0ABP8NHA2_9BACT
MFRDKKLTYITLFSSGGVGCYGFKMEGYHCVATNEIIPKRMEIQKANNICQYDSGYIVGDISESDTKEKIYAEMRRWKSKGNDRVDVVLATPPCQGISVINHKKNSEEINRNSLVVESIAVVKHIKPRVFVFENVMAFQKTQCTTPDGRIIPIGDYVKESLGQDYIISGRIINLMNYGSNSSRTRTLMVGVDKTYRNSITPYDILPHYQKEKTLRDVISKFPSLEWGEICSDDFYHAFRTYNPKMRDWIHGLKEGQSAFDNPDPHKRPHRIDDGKHVENIRKNRDKYTRQRWDRFVQCIHTRNDQLAAQNTVHPVEDRVYSIRELMEMMTIPSSFKWVDKEIEELNRLSNDAKRLLYKNHELTIRQCIGEAVPTESMRRIAENIKICLLKNHLDPSSLNRVISQFDLDQRAKLRIFLKANPLNLDVSALMRITELCNAKREENAAFYTNKFIVNEIMGKLPDFNKDEIRILEPSVGAGNFIPFLIKRYENVSRVTLDVVDIDEDSIETLKLILEKIAIPNNFTINIICHDFLLMDITSRYDLVVGNPPFSKLDGKSKEKAKYLKQNINQETANLSEMFLEKCLKYSDCVALVLNKTLLSNHEFKVTRDILRSMKLDSIIDFGRHGFTGVSIETMCLIVYPKQKPTNTFVYSMKYNKSYNQRQEYITDSRFPYFIIYRNEEFDKVAKKLEFDVFDVFRDRQITKANTTTKSTGKSLWVIKGKNINDSGELSHVRGYDMYIHEKTAENTSAFKYVNDNSVYLTPNMTYNPRVIENHPNTITDGSTAVLIPKYGFKLTRQQMAYFSTDEYRQFYAIARNLSTQSINVDKTSVFFYGKLKEK